MNQQELSKFDTIGKNLADLNKTLKTISDNYVKLNSNTNKTTMTSKLVDAINGINKSLIGLNGEIKSLNENVVDIKSELNALKKTI